MTKWTEGNPIEVQLDTRGGIMRTSYLTSGGKLGRRQQSQSTYVVRNLDIIADKLVDSEYHDS